MPIQLLFVKFSNIMLENEEAFETAKEAKNSNQNFDYSLLQSLSNQWAFDFALHNT